MAAFVSYARFRSFVGGAKKFLLHSLFVVITLTLISLQGQAQQKARYVKLRNCNGYYEYLPKDYSSHPDKKYPLLLYIHGQGEIGNGSPEELPKVLRNGPPKRIKNGSFPSSVTVNGKTFSFIVISPQFVHWPVDNADGSDVQSVLDYVLAHYRVDPSRIYLTGISMGGGVVWNYAGMNSKTAAKLAAIVPIAGASYPSPVRAINIASQNLPVWALHNKNDPTVTSSYSIEYVNQINAFKPQPKPKAKLTLFPRATHNAWTEAYNPKFKDNNMNVYQWMLQYSRPGNTTTPSKPATNEAPSATAGSDISVTLPGIATLTGKGSDADGSIASYKWTRKSGPSAFKLSDASAAKTTLSNLTAGTYVFTLTVTDNNGAKASDDITITVKSAPNKTPVVKAGSDISVTLPASSVALKGSATDADGSIASYKWTEKSGPDGIKLTNATTSKATLSHLVAGTYVFTLTVTDNKGAKASDNITITVKAAPNKAPVAKAGSNISITLPSSSATLSGSGSDADGSIASYKWVKKSGPAGAKLSNASAAKTTLSNLTTGTYVFTLTVTDNKGRSASSDITVTVLPAPQGSKSPEGADKGDSGQSDNESSPLAANAGPDTTVYMPFNSLDLNGTRSKDKDGLIITYAWEKVSGPSCTIKYPGKNVTEVKNLATGKYVFKLTVKDNKKRVATDLTTVTVMEDSIPSGNLSYTANDIVKPYQSPFSYGINPGYYANGWDDMKVAAIALKAGVHTSRPTLPDKFVGKWGYDTRLREFDYYKNTLGFKDLTLFIEKPRPEYRDKTTYPGADSQSKIFANLYKPIWDNGVNGTPINDENYFALYVYNIVKRYGKYVKFWEVWNEPDITYGWRVAQGSKDDPDSWWNVPPAANSLYNLKAPVYSYIRMLRIAYEVIKKMDPDDYVTTGGLGYPSFLDAVLRYTDNPDGGKVSKDYPLKGGAYFDVLSFHSYPAFSLKFWDGSIGGFRYERNSDKAADAVISSRDNFEQVLEDRGYNGKKYPKKLYILTEVNIPRKRFEDRIGSDEAQRNFAIKMLVNAQKEDIKQVYFYGIGESADYGAAKNEYQLMGLYQNLTKDAPGSEKLTQEGMAFKTTSHFLYGYVYDDARTKALKLPATVEGAAFRKGSDYRYVLWAKTHKDLSEAVNAVYSFPADLKLGKVYQYQWNYSADKEAVQLISSTNIPLTGTPVFISTNKLEVSVNVPPQANAGNDATITLPNRSVTLDGSASNDPDGIITAYKWTKKSGPDGVFTSSNLTTVKPKIGNLQEGTYVFSLWIKDNKGATDSDDVTIIVKGAPNKAPRANAGSNLTVLLPSNTVKLVGSASSDPDGNIVSYKWTKKSGPDSYSITNASKARATIRDLVEGTYVFTLTVKDNDGDADSDDITVTVGHQAPTGTNDPPHALAKYDRTITLPDNSVNLVSYSTDTGGKVVVLKWSKKSGPDSFKFSSTTDDRVTVSHLVAGTYVFTLTVTDNGGATSTDDVTIIVNPKAKDPNKAPKAVAEYDRTITLPDNSVNLVGSYSTDPDGRVVAFKWTKKSGPDSFKFSSTTDDRVTVSNLTAGTYVFTLTVTDERGGTGTDDVTIVVVKSGETPAPPKETDPGTDQPEQPAGKNEPPHAVAEYDRTITLPDNSVNLVGSYSTDPDGNVVAFRWSKKSGPASFDFTSPGKARTTVKNLTAGTYIFTLTVTDNGGAKGTDDVTIIVKPKAPDPNRLPHAVAEYDRTITLPDNSVNLVGDYSTDPDGNVVAFKWSKKSGPDTFKFSSTSGRRISVRNLVAGTYVFTLTVTDDRGGTDTDDVTVTVLRGDNYIRYKNTAVIKTEDSHYNSPFKINVWPNPVTSVVNVEMTNAARGKMNIEVYDAGGKPVKSFTSSKSSDHWQKNFDISSLDKGIYFLHIEMSDLSGTVKIIKGR